MNNSFYQDSKQAVLSPIIRIRNPRTWIYCASLAAVMTATITLEEVREVSIVNKLFSQNGGVEHGNSNPILIDSNELNRLNRSVDYLKQRGVNPNIPLINFYNHNLTL